jgi:16S rRNA (uracil1498-N3)-methyltransferase
MTAPLFYVDALPPAGTVRVTGEEARHATSALRVGAGEDVLLGDGAGLLAHGTVTASDRRTGLLVEITAVQRKPIGHLRVVQAVPKGERGELAVELLTETGAAVIVPWTSRRTVADWRGKEQAKQARWQRVARAAAKQARRAHIPVIADPVAGIPPIDGQGLVLHEQAHRCLFDVEVSEGPVTVVVGPEGGLSGEEVDALVAAGATAVHMGPLILRTSTAGAAACVWLQGLETRLRDMT